VSGETGPLQEVTPLDAGLELLDREEEVVPLVSLPLARRPRGRRDRNDEFRETRQYAADEGAFACTGRTGDDDESGNDRS
jgi:hypothetical protein